MLLPLKKKSNFLLYFSVLCFFLWRQKNFKTTFVGLKWSKNFNLFSRWEKFSYYHICVVYAPPLKLISKFSDGLGDLGLSGVFYGRNLMHCFLCKLTNQNNKFSFNGRKNCFFQKKFKKKNKGKSQISKKFSDGFGLF